MRATPRLESVTELDRWISEFEQQWQNTNDAELSRFLPDNHHPQFGRILCELICVDLEMRWSRGKPKPLEEYGSEYPQLFGHEGVVQELAYEEYRQRLQAGTTVDPSEYRDRFGVDVSEWPANSQRPSTQLEERTRLMESVCMIEGLPQTAEANAAIAQSVRKTLPPEAAARYDRATAEMPKRGDKLFGFELTDQLGEGAFAKVFLARQLKLADRPVVLKVAPSLRDEPRRLARLQHTNIVPIYSAHEEGAIHAVCMPYLGFMTLAHILKNVNPETGSFPASGKALLNTLFNRRTTVVNSNPTSSNHEPETPAPDVAIGAPILDMVARLSHVETTLWMAARLADGLSHAHERGILHLDLKPANILVTDDGQPMLLDFNLSVDLKDAVSREMARLGGTFPYMSPEQLEAFRGGERKIDARSDLYSLGIILFEMLTGRSPFPKLTGPIGDAVSRMIAHRKEPTPSLRALNPSITPAEEAIVQKLLKHDRSLRYQTASQLREDLDRHLANLPLKHASNRSVRERFRKWRQRHPRLATASIVAVAATLILILPATVIAIRQSEIAERKMQIETAEAKQLWHETAPKARQVQVMLATHLGNRADLDHGLKLGREVVERYRIDSNGFWAREPIVARLPSDDQAQLRFECGEMLLFMARGEHMLAGDNIDQQQRTDGLRQALHWIELAAESYPAHQIPRMLATQQDRVLKDLGEEADHRIGKIDANSLAEQNPYHDGVMLANEGKHREALALLAPFTEKNPKHYQSWFARGLCHEILGELADSTTCWTACIALDPTLGLANFNRGVIRLEQAEYAKANEDFTEAIRLKPDWLDAFTNRAIARKHLKDYAGAIKDLDEVIANSDSPVREWFLRGEIHDLDGKLDAAKADQAQGFKLKPKDELGWTTRGYTRRSTDPANALKDFDEAIKINRRYRDALIHKSIVLSEYLQRPTDAVKVLDQVLEYYPENVGARGGRGVILARLGQCDKARKDAEDCLKHDRSPFFMFQAAGLYAQISRHEPEGDGKNKALALLASAIRKGFSDLNLMKTDTDLDPIRNEEEFRRLLQVMAVLEKSPQR